MYRLRTVVLEQDQIVAGDTIALAGLTLPGPIIWVNTQADLDNVLTSNTPTARVILGRSANEQDKSSVDWALEARRRHKLATDTAVGIYTRDEALIGKAAHALKEMGVGVFYKLKVAEMLLWMATVESRKTGFIPQENFWNPFSEKPSLAMSLLGNRMEGVLSRTGYREDLVYDQVRAEQGLQEWSFGSGQVVIPANESLGLFSNLLHGDGNPRQPIDIMRMLPDDLYQSTYNLMEGKINLREKER